MNITPLQSSAAELPRRVSVCALITCFNRRDKTVACLRALGASEGLDSVVLRAVLVDDGSSDGTAQAVREEFPWVEIVVSDGSLYWCRGMHLAFATAMATGFDHYLWLNDDTMLKPDALSGMLRCEAELRERIAAPVIIVGSTADPLTGAPTYGGERRPSRLRPFSVRAVAPTEVAQRCDTLTGNVVLVPALAARRVGNLDSAFEHAMADTDYGLRAVRRGVQLWVAPRVQGTCAHNPVAGTYVDDSLSPSKRWQLMLDRKGLPWRSWLTFTRRHTGVMWPLYFAWPYAKLLIGSHLTTRLRRTRQAADPSGARSKK